MWPFKFFREALHELRAIHLTLHLIGESMSIDTSKLIEIDQAILDSVSGIPAVVTGESAKIQTAIDNLASVISSDPAAQAVIDAEVARLSSVPTALGAISDSINALPTTPTPPAA